MQTTIAIQYAYPTSPMADRLNFGRACYFLAEYDSRLNLIRQHGGAYANWQDADVAAAGTNLPRCKYSQPQSA